MATDIGKKFEDQLQAGFRTLKKSHHLGWHRFSDTGSAGGALVEAQPSDYLVVIPSGTALPGPLAFVEAKASEKYSALQKAMLRPSQRGAIRFYQGLLQIPYYVLFWDAVGDELQLWDGLTALSSKRKKSPISRKEKISCGTRIDQPLLTQTLTEWWNIPEPSTTLSHLREPE